MLVAIEILGIISMIVFLFVLIWGFILMNQVFAQLRYGNYLMEKLAQHVYMLSKKDDAK